MDKDPWKDIDRVPPADKRAATTLKAIKAKLTVKAYLQFLMMISFLFVNFP